MSRGSELEDLAGRGAGMGGSWAMTWGGGGSGPAAPDQRADDADEGELLQREVRHLPPPRYS